MLSDFYAISSIFSSDLNWNISRRLTYIYIYILIINYIYPNRDSKTPKYSILETPLVMVLKKEYIGKCNSSLFLYWCSILNCTINMCQVVHLLMQLRVCSDTRGIWAKMAVYLILLRYRIAIIVIFNRKRLVFLRIRDAIDYIASHIASYVPLLSWTHFIMDSVALTNIFMDSCIVWYTKDQI